MTLGEFREQTKGLSDDLVLEFYSERYNDSTQPIRLEFDTEGYVEFVIDDDRWCLKQDPLTDVLDKIKADIEQYQADCDLSCSDDGNCKTCNNITFGSIYRIIDKYKNEMLK